MKFPFVCIYANELASTLSVLTVIVSWVYCGLVAVCKFMVNINLKTFDVHSC